MKKYSKPNIISNSKTKNLAPIVGAVAGLSVGGAALVGAAMGLASKGRDFQINTTPALKPVTTL
ncbi:hypothetical protein GKZ28_25005 [Clostridium chromiireducens]|uniref:Uncharacterized protein n=1 Tax=Clostridium chromiireducens TaxID=225345 RepID=A0A964W4V6_9CLOT|nr:hypothetical protein [Clostridium chromiireducens]MVX66921.1 hypothetical protein [Clostridium chromiireducens]